MKKSLVYFRILTPILLMTMLFAGCSGDDGAAGPAGAPGAPGAPGDPGTGVLVSESCVVCHADGRIADVSAMHNPPAGAVTAEITSAAFSPAGDNASVTFTFAVTDAAGNPVPVNLTEAAAGSTNLRYLRFTIARLVPGQVYDISTRDPDAWFYYGPRSHRRAANLQDNGGGSYTYTFTDDTVLDPAEAGFTHRVGFELNIGEFSAALSLRSVNPTFDWVPDGVTAVRSREIVTTAACNECHNPLGYTPAFHGRRRVDTAYCVLCHNPNNALAPQSADPGAPSVPIPFVKAIHGVHTGKNLLVFEGDENHGDFTEVTYPQDIRNCNKCHKGAQGQNWNTLPSREACGTCHTDVNFDTGAGHLGGAHANNRLCAVCHPAGEIEKYHLTENVTPNNTGVPAGLSNFEYVIDEVTVNSDNAAVVTFHIDRNGAPIDLTSQPENTSGGPSFLVAYALPQDGIAAPVDYNNLGRSGGQPATVSLASVRSALTGSAASYTVTLAAAPFPAGATLRAVALQGYFTEDTGTDNVARHAPSVVKAATGDAERRTIIKSGYNATTGAPEGCLECHEILELHGGNRVNNVQVCVICHNPNLSSSGRTIDPAGTINQSVIDAVGSDPLVYPEASMHFKNLIHGIHKASDRPYEFVRNFRGGSYYNWSEVTFPGNLMACTKCHVGTSYMPDELPEGILVSTERTTTGDSAEILADIVAARAGVPNDTDWVNSPIASACYYCHDGVLAKAHMEANGGKIRAERENVVLSLTP